MNFERRVRISATLSQQAGCRPTPRSGGQFDQIAWQTPPPPTTMASDDTEAHAEPGRNSRPVAAFKISTRALAQDGLRKHAMRSLCHVHHLSDVEIGRQAAERVSVLFRQSAQFTDPADHVAERLPDGIVEI